MLVLPDTELGNAAGCCDASTVLDADGKPVNELGGREHGLRGAAACNDVSTLLEADGEPANELGGREHGPRGVASCGEVSTVLAVESPIFVLKQVCCCRFMYFLFGVHAQNL